MGPAHTRRGYSPFGIIFFLIIMAEPPPPEQSAGQISAIFLASVAILYDKFFNLTLSLPGTERSRYPAACVGPLPFPGREVRRAGACPRRLCQPFAFPSGERPGRRVRDCRALQSPKAPSDEGAVSRQADWGRDTGGHMGPPLQNPLKCNVERRRGQAPALRCCVTWGRRVRDAAPYRVASPTPAAPRGSTSGGASKRVERKFLCPMPHSGNGRENGLVSETTPRRYISAKLPNQALP